jgi:hypothetical protein
MLANFDLPPHFACHVSIYMKKKKQYEGNPKKILQGVNRTKKKHYREVVKKITGVDQNTPTLPGVKTYLLFFI